MLQSLFEEDHEQEVVLLCVVLLQCLFVLSVFVLSPDLILQSCFPVFCPSGFRAASQSSQDSVLYSVSFAYGSKVTSALEEMKGALRICPELVVALFYHFWGVEADEAGWVQFLL